MLKALQRRWQTWRANRRQAILANITERRAINDSLWHATVAELPFVAALPMNDQHRLRQLSSLFLDSKEFSGAQGFEVTDTQAVMVAAQACLVILHIAPADRPDTALAWYDGFVGIVLHAGEVKAEREWIDENGISHSGSEWLTGEILEGGPLMLAWSDVQAAGKLASQAYNVVIHEFIHVMDVRDGIADGCPPMPRDQRRQWLATLQAAYERFKEASDAWQRFGKLSGLSEVLLDPVLDPILDPILDPYGSESIEEFFAVAAEAYFVQRERFAQSHPDLLAMFDGFFRSGSVL